MPTVTALVLSLLLATAILPSLGLGLGRVVQRFTGNSCLRALGGLAMAGGALVMEPH